MLADAIAPPAHANAVNIKNDIRRNKLKKIGNTTKRSREYKHLIVDIFVNIRSFLFI